MSHTVSQLQEVKSECNQMLSQFLDLFTATKGKILQEGRPNQKGGRGISEKVWLQVRGGAVRTLYGRR